MHMRSSSTRHTRRYVSSHSIRLICCTQVSYLSIITPHSATLASKLTADLLFCTAYTNLYVIMPGESIQVEAATDPIGLKIGIVYDAAPEGKILMYQMWKVKNGSVLTITYVNGGDISTFGGECNVLLLQSKSDKQTRLLN